MGVHRVGGLVGRHQRGRLSNTYATGNVTLSASSDNSMGWLGRSFPLVLLVVQ